MRYIFLYESDSILYESNLLEIFSNICLIIMFYLNKLAGLSEMVLMQGKRLLTFCVIIPSSPLEVCITWNWICGIVWCKKGTELYPLVNLNWNTQ